jgi:hypothetical protein
MITKGVIILEEDFVSLFSKKEKLTKEDEYFLDDLELMVHALLGQEKIAQEDFDNS